MYTSRIYRFSPILLQNIMISVRGYALRTLRNSNYQAELKNVEQSQCLSKESLLQLQLKRLQTVVNHAAMHVPYYRDAFAAAKFSPEQLKSLADIQRIPLLSKDQVFNAGERMLAENWKGYRFPGWTSGTTGRTLKLARSMHSIHRENVFLWRQCRWAGATPGNRRVWIRGDKMVPANTQKPPFWRYNKADNTLMMSAYHLSEQNVEAYLQALEAYDPIFGMAYPSPLVFLARYLLNTGRKYGGKSLKSFITSSESANPEHRKIIEKAFGCRVFDWYGSAERVSAIGTCEQGNYHVLSDYGYTELVPQENGVYELVGTGFDNLLMPLIRYQSEDTIVPAHSDYQCPCGRIGFPVVEQVIGRVEDYLIRPDGRQIFMMSNITKTIENILVSQIRQETPDEIKILLVPAKGCTVNEQAVINSAQEFLGEDMRIVVEQVNEIPKTSNGKFRAVVRAI